jgi:hypothetical protein
MLRNAAKANTTQRDHASRSLGLVKYICFPEFPYLQGILKQQKLHSGRDLLLLIVSGRTKSVNWIIAYPEAFIEILVEFNAEARAIILFNLRRK